MFYSIADWTNDKTMCYKVTRSFVIIVVLFSRFPTSFFITAVVSVWKFSVKFRAGNVADETYERERTERFLVVLYDLFVLNELNNNLLIRSLFTS